MTSGGYGDVEDHQEGRGGGRVWPAFAALLVIATVSCAEPEQTTFPLTISSIDEAEVCAVGPDTDERCFPSEELSLPDDVSPHLDDCLTVEVDGDGRTDVTSAVWRGRCSAGPVALGVTARDTGPTVLIPECLGSFTSLRVEDAEGTIRWSIARESSTEHPLIEYVTLGLVPPGFVEHDPWTGDAGIDERLTIRANQQSGLPPGSTQVVANDLDSSVLVGDEVVADDADLDEAAGCRSAA